MTAFTSSTSGNWNDGATWGKTSPGVKGIDWPGAAGDTFTVAAGHTVTYNVSETNELGASTINGLLTFSTGRNTLLTFGHVDLTIGATGELRIGASGAPIEAAYTAQCLWTCTSDGAKGLVVNSGGKFTTYGESRLNNKIRAVTVSYSGTSLKIEGDYSAAWKNNDSIVVYRNSAYGHFRTDVVPLTINGTPVYNAGTDQTTVTVDQTAAGTWQAGGYSWNLTRNVWVGRYVSDSEPWVLDNGGALKKFNNRPRIVNNNSANNNFDTSFTSFNALYSITNPNGCSYFNHCVFRHCYRLFDNVYGANCTAGIAFAFENYTFVSLIKGICDYDIVGCEYIGTIAIDCLFSGHIVSSGSIVGGNNNSIYTGDFASVAYGFNGTAGPIVCKNNKIYNCNYFNVSAGNTVKMYDTVLGKDSKGNSRPNTNDFRFSQGHVITMINPNLPTSMSLYGRDSVGFTGRYIIESYNGVVGDDRIVDCFGDLYRITAGNTGEPNQRHISNDQYLKCTTQSNCSPRSYLKILEVTAYCAANTEKAWRVYCQSDAAATIGSGNRSDLVSGISMELSYLNGVTVSSRTVVRSSRTIAARSGVNDWSQYLECVAKPAYAGSVYITVYLMTHIGSGKYLWVDPRIAEIAAEPIQYSVNWVQGMPVLGSYSQTEAWLVADAVWEKQTSDPVLDGSYGEKVGGLKSAYAWKRTA
jgi:hypothetical protein